MQDPPDIHEVITKLKSKLPVCRVCLNLSMEYIEFDSALCLFNGTDITYFDAFELVTQSEVELLDGLPKTLCSACGNDLLNAYLFRKRVNNADIILNKIISKNMDFFDTNIENTKQEQVFLLADNTAVVDALQVDILSDDSKLNDAYRRRQCAEINESCPSSPKNSLFTESNTGSVKEAGTLSEYTESCCEVYTSYEVPNTNYESVSNEVDCGCDNVNRTLDSLDHRKSSYFDTSTDSKKLLCKLSKKKCKSEENAIHKDKKLYHCKSCKEKFFSRYLLSSHTFRFHKSIQRDAASLKKLKIEKKEKCTVCYKMVRKSFMEIHKEVHFGPCNSMCTECGKQFSSRLALRTHSLIHRQSGEYLCHICNKICQTMYALKSHIQFKHTADKASVGRNKFKYQCEDCGLIFQYPSKLRVHQRKHNAETPYICPHCSRSYLRKDQFNIHMRYHNNDLPYKCDQCDKSYATKNNLSEHRKSVHDNITYSCDKCDQKFKSVTGLRKHKFVHTGYPYVCPICGLGQPFRSGIKAHLLRVHKDTFTEEEFDETFPVVIPKSGFRRPKI